MNSISFLQTAAQLDSKNIFRRVIDNALSTGTEALLEWRRFEPELFGIETPRHSPIFAKKVNLPYYALLSDAVQETTLEELAKHYADEFGLNFTYITEGDHGIISVYIASHEVENDTLIDLLDEDEAAGVPPSDDDADDEIEPQQDNPDILVNGDVLVDGINETVKEIQEIHGVTYAILGDGRALDVLDIFEDGDGGYEYIPSDDEDEDEDEDDGDEIPGVLDFGSDSDDEDDEDEFEVEGVQQPAEILVPQIRESEPVATESGDDDFPEEDLQPQTSVDAEEQSEDEALAAAVAEEQAAQAEPAAIDWSRPPVEAVPAQAAASAVEGVDDTFAEEPQPKAVNVAQTEPQEPSEPVAEPEPVALVIDGEQVSEAEFNRRAELLIGLRDQLPNDSVSEITDGILNILIVKDEAEYDLSVKVVQQLFAGAKMIDIFALSSKDGSVARRATNAAAILDVINSL